MIFHLRHINTFRIFLLLHTSTLLYSQSRDIFALDFLGDSHYSLYNFTDAIIPYYAQDTWTEVKATIWINEERRVAPYFSFLASHMGYIPRPSEIQNIPPFFWQKFIQGTAGVQYYPFYGEDYNPSFGLRLFTLVAYRHYYARQSITVPYSHLVEYDIQAGGDYYYDNIFNTSEEGFVGKNKIVLSSWANATFRHTNFNRKSYNAFFITANIKAGRKLKLYKRSIFFPYLLVDGAWIPFCKKKSKWFENYIHFGSGIRFYPWTLNKLDKPSSGILRRMHFYFEYLRDGVWLNGYPPERTKRWDLRYGIGFSTPGIFRSKEKEMKL